uniref:Uncharacterized protein n=1 Tax=Anguilla anguilla TaxID=7936 RepID=A0A0E9WK09_ANGAN
MTLHAVLSQSDGSSSSVGQAVNSTGRGCSARRMTFGFSAKQDSLSIRHAWFWNILWSLTLNK